MMRQLCRNTWINSSKVVVSFVSDLQSSPLITNPPTSLGSLIELYNDTLYSLLDKHAPVITRLSKHTSKSNPWFTSTLRVFRSTVRRAESIWKTHILLLTGPLSNISETVATISFLLLVVPCLWMGLVFRYCALLGQTWECLWMLFW